jgi:lysophospholipase L1-like esterase
MQVVAVMNLPTAIVACGNNDIYAGTAAAAVEASRTSIRGYFSALGMSVYDATITTRTTSTNNWIDVTNQTLASAPNNTARITFNTDGRNGVFLASGSAGLIDTAGVLETSAANPWVPFIDGGFWIPGMVYCMTSGCTPDGTHPNTWGYQRATPIVLQALGVRR